MTPTRSTETPNADLTRIIDGRHHDPHAVLGPHATSDGVIIRAYHPGAERIAAVWPGGEVELAKVDSRGLFEGAAPRQFQQAYRLRLQRGDANWEWDDPYRFLPTLGELDLHLITEGAHRELWRRLGARIVEQQGVRGVSFAVWAPNAEGVRLVSDANHWDTRVHPMRSLGSSGVWELFLPGARAGLKYKFAVNQSTGSDVHKADPMAKCMEPVPGTASVVVETNHEWGDHAWMRARNRTDHLGDPMSVYEVHLASWQRAEGGDALNYREAGQRLATYCRDLGFTHIELLPVAEHPYSGSWGYQVTGYYAPTSRFGTPDDFRWMVDHLHQMGIGVILDWVPAHFPRDDWALAKFDGTALYEHADPRSGEHPDWGTLVFNYGRNEVRNFLVANAQYWCEEFHIDALRVDAVASMLYLDYSRNAGEWVPNKWGGRENLDAITMLREVNERITTDYPGAIAIAEESTAWPGVSTPIAYGGLGFRFKWNMGWMHDTLDYLAKDPLYRRYHHHQLTFGMWYAYSEKFVLPLSHDEVVHGKGSLLNKMPGDEWQRFANLRALYGWMWAHPGKKLLFQGGEIGQGREWDAEGEIEWWLLQYRFHSGMQTFVRDLNARYRQTPALFERDYSENGFMWIDAGNVDQSVYSFARFDANNHPGLVCVANFSPAVYSNYRVGLPAGGPWDEVLNGDATEYGGSGAGNCGSVHAEDVPWNGQPHSAGLTVPPLAVLWLRPAL